MYLLRKDDVCKQTGLSRSSLYRLISNDDFPHPVKIGVRAVAWRSTDVQEWIESRIQTNQKSNF